MNQDTKKFFYKLLTTPGPTGFEEKIQKVVKSRMKDYADFIDTDLHGNLIVGLNTKAETKVMLAGHCDQIGFMVNHVTKDGFIYLSPLGGIDTTVLFGTKVVIHAAKEKVVGVIGKKPIHLQRADERGKAKADFNNLWVDIGAKDKKEVEKHIQIGDPVTFDPGVTECFQDHVSSPAIDNRAGLFVVMEALRLCAKKKLNVALYSVSTVQEEVGLRGATTASYSIDPDIGLGVDVTHATDNPGYTEKKAPPCLLGGGPVIVRGPNVNPIVEKRLLQAARKYKIPYQINPSSRLLGNDTRAMQINRAGMATGSIGLPNRYMHTQVEMCSLKDLTNSAKLIAKFVQDISKSTDFTPR